MNKNNFLNVYFLTNKLVKIAKITLFGLIVIYFIYKDLN